MPDIGQALPPELPGVSESDFHKKLGLLFLGFWCIQRHWFVPRSDLLLCVPSGLTGLTLGSESRTR
jgi:hypothetical protein